MMNDLDSLGHALIGVGNHGEMREILLCEFGGGVVVVGDDHHTNAPSVEVGMLFFELNQLAMQTGHKRLRKKTSTVGWPFARSSWENTRPSASVVVKGTIFSPV